MSQDSQKPSLSVSQIVAEQNRLWMQRWWDCEDGFPALGPTYTLREKLDREDYLAQFVDQLMAEAQQPPRSEVERAALQRRLLDLARITARNGLDLNDDPLDIIEEAGFGEAAMDFIRMARRFDPAIPGQDIYQASRNVWTMNLIQFLFGLPVRVTPAIFAYSMLYPYSDNLLDDPTLAPSAKQEFNQRFFRRLLGETVSPSDGREQKIFDLVGQVEEQYERRAYPQVYESLIAIHKAQARSLTLLRRRASPYEVDVLGTSFEKGGTAVLADGYLVAGVLTPGQREFLYGYGAFTQLMDDQEDLEADRKAGILTIFSQTAQGWSLDAVANRLFHFGGIVMDELDRFERPGVGPLKGLVSRSIDLLLALAAARSDHGYTHGYRRALEAHLPFRISYMERMRRRLERRQALLAHLLDGANVKLA